MDDGYYWARRKQTWNRKSPLEDWAPALYCAHLGKVQEIGDEEWEEPDLYDIGPRIPQYVPDDKSKTAEYPPVELDITVEDQDG